MKNESLKLYNKNLLIQTVNGFIKRLNSVESFVLEQMPDLCKEIITLKINIQLNYMITNIMLMCSGIIILIPSIWFTRFLFILNKNNKDCYNDYVLSLIFLVFPSLVFTVIMLIGTIERLINIRQIKMSPKVYLLDYFKNIFNKTIESE